MPALLADAAQGLAAGVMSGLDDLFTSDQERAEAELRLRSLMMQPHILQAATTLKEAQHPSVWVSGWRPGLGWMCVAGLGYQLVARPLMATALVIADPLVAADLAVTLPELNGETLMALVTTLLGLGGARTFERVRGKA